MIERHVYVRLKAEYKSERAAMAAYSRDALARVPGVVDVIAGTPADEHADKAWDLGLTIRFASLDDVEGYRVHPEHQRYLDEYLSPRAEVKKVWNFEVP